MKTPFVQLAGLALWGALSMFTLPNQAFAGDEDLQDFVTETGRCSLTEKAELQDQADVFPSYSYTLDSTQIYQRRSISQKTDTIIPPLTRLNCLAKSAGTQPKMLVIGARDISPYCGWVEVDSLLKANAENDLVFGADLEPCSRIKPVALRDFCTKMKNLETPASACSNNYAMRSARDTKFITGAPTASTDEINLYPTSQSAEVIGKVRIFNNLEVYDVAKNENTGAVRLLVGTGGTDLKGWLDYSSGFVLNSNLSIFFSAAGTKDIYQSEAGIRDNQVLAIRPKNLGHTLGGNREFPKFPVLFDNLLEAENSPPNTNPHFQIAFIGRYCEDADSSFCSVKTPPEPLGVDIMFLIDGTLSMGKYFSLVSRAVSEFTDDYIDDPNYRFGVSTYGDFKKRSLTETADPLDFKTVEELQVNLGDMFEDLGQTKLYIKDVMKDKAEPTNAAIYNAVRNTQWRENNLRFLIHIADHGDRVDPSELMLDALKENKIFYIPIAVKGGGVIPESQEFVRQSNIIYEKHRAENGAPMALQPVVTHEQNVSEFEAIAQVLVGVLNVGTEAQSEIDQDEKSTIDSPIAELTEAAKKLYFPVKPEQDYETITLKGFIETVPIGDKEANWDYFVTLDNTELLDLNRSMETVCLAIGGSNDRKIIEGSIWQMIETLTGDKLTTDDLADFWSDRNSVPLIDQTFLGDGMKDFLRHYSDVQKLSKYKKAFCRGYELTSLMQAGKKLPEPYEGGSLIWTGEYYETKDEVDHKWLYKDFFERGYYYVPLTYLPNWLN